MQCWVWQDMRSSDSANWRMLFLTMFSINKDPIVSNPTTHNSVVVPLVQQLSTWILKTLGPVPRYRWDMISQDSLVIPLLQHLITWLSRTLDPVSRNQRDIITQDSVVVPLLQRFMAWISRTLGPVSGNRWDIIDIELKWYWIVRALLVFIVNDCWLRRYPGLDLRVEGCCSISRIQIWISNCIVLSFGSCKHVDVFAVEFEWYWYARTLLVFLKRIVGFEDIRNWIWVLIEFRSKSRICLASSS